MIKASVFMMEKNWYLGNLPIYLIVWHSTFSCQFLHCLQGRKHRAVHFPTRSSPLHHAKWKATSFNSSISAIPAISAMTESFRITPWFVTFDMLWCWQLKKDRKNTREWVYQVYSWNMDCFFLWCFKQDFVLQYKTSCCNDNDCVSSETIIKSNK